MNNQKLEQKISNTDFSLFMRQLHILALVQHSLSAEQMNYRTMADLLSCVPWDEAVNEKMIARCVGKLKEMGFPVHTSKGETRVVLERELVDDEMLEVLPYYLNVISDTIGIRDCFKSYVQSHGSRSLWIIARIYFASLQKKKIKLTYRPLKSSEPENYILNPYRWIYRDNAVYLIAKNPKRGVALFKLNRIRDVIITDNRFHDKIPPVDELMQNSMGAFISDKKYNVKIRFLSELQENIEEVFGHLELMFYQKEKDGYVNASFTACDLVNVYQAVFGYGGGVRIIEPKEAVDGMLRFLNLNMDLYK